MECEPRQLERRLARVAQGTPHGYTVAPDSAGFRVLPRGDAPLDVPNTPHILLELGLRMVIGFGDRLDGFLEIMVVT